MSVTKLVFTKVVAICLVSTCALAVSKPKLQVLYSFAGKADGNGPRAALLQDSAGNLYGTTAFGGKGQCAGRAYGCGTVFELSPPQGSGTDWTEQVLYRFSGGSDGGGPIGRLIADQSGNLYGTAFEGGNADCGENGTCGLVFELSPPSQPGGNWKETVIHSFTGYDGGLPQAGLTFDNNGNLYGTASYNQNSPGCGGTIFELTPPQSQGEDWTYSDLYDLTDLGTGCLPLSDLIFDNLGNLYGTTCTGDLSGGGVVFELAPPEVEGEPWLYSVLYGFAQNTCPRAGLASDSEGNLYGTATNIAFELEPSGGGIWSLQILSSLVYSYAGVILHNEGKIYGTESGNGCGSVFRLANSEGRWIKQRYSLSNNSGLPCAPQGALIFGTNQTSVFATSETGGTYKKGTVFVIAQ